MLNASATYFYCSQIASTFLRLLELLYFYRLCLPYLFIVNNKNKKNICSYFSLPILLSDEQLFIWAVIIFNMFIDSPNFVRRRIVNSQSPSEFKKEEQFISFGKERQKIFSYVANTLLEHERDQQILQQFRREAELIKKRKFQSKRQPKHTSFVSPLKAISQRLPIHSQERQEKIEKDQLVTPQRVVAGQQPLKHPELEVVLRHSNELVEKYRKLLSIKEKQLKKKDRKLESSKLAMHKMSMRMKELERQRKRVDRQEEVELQKIEVTLRQMDTQISQNKNSVARQISALKEELNYSFTQDLPLITQFSASRHQLKENLLPKMAVPQRQQLQGIKRKAKSLKTNKIQEISNPSIVYTKVQTECSKQVESPRSKGYVHSLDNSSMIGQSHFCSL